MTLRVRLVLLSALLVRALPGAAAERLGVALPDTVTVEGRQLQLNGIGVRDATLLKVHVYVAGLYLPTRTSAPEAIIEAQEPKVILLRFVRGVGRKDIVKAWNEGFERNTPAETASLRQRLDLLDAWMGDVAKGQEMSFTYVPGSGVTVAIDGRARGVIPGDDFARALFSVWLGPSPADAGLKDELLGKR
jgi:hypothetical protein